MDEEQHSMGGGVKRPNEDYEEDEGDMGGSQLKKRRGEGPQVEMRILVPSKNAGAIIGKGGENIKRLRNDFKASISVPDSGGPERILTVCSDAGSACAVLLDVVPHLAVEERRGRDENADCDIRMLVHQSQAGCVIGRAGFKIKELREQTGANIRVYSMCCPRSTERVIMVSGKPQIVVNCIATIFDLLQTAPPKGPIDPYEPDNFDESLVNDYGGFTMAEGRGRPGGGRGFRGGGGGGGGPRMGSRGGNMGGGFRDGGGMRRLPVSPRSGGGSRMGGMGMGGGGGGGGGMGGFGRDRGNNGGGFGSGGPSGGRGPRGGMGGGGMGRGDFDSGYGRRNSMMDDDGYGDGFGMGGGGGGGPRSRGGMGRNGPGMGGDGGGARTTTQVSIPKEYAGAIIGKSGSRIQQVRRESGADITIAEALPGSNDRIITITGSSDQIQSAQFLLQLSVKDYLR